MTIGSDCIRARLEPLGTEERAVHERRYLKSELEFLGVEVPLVRKEAKSWLREHAEVETRDLVALSEAPWDRGVHELRSFGVELKPLHAAR